MDSGSHSWRAPYSSGVERTEVRYLQNSPFFKVVFSLTFFLAFLFFLVSLYAMFSPSHSADFMKPSPVYFFVLILNTPFFPVPTIWVAIGMAVLYSIFFASIIYLGFSKFKGPLMDNPILYYGGMASFGYLMSLVISLIELALGVQIGGTTIETGLQQHPYLSFIQLIYAPFAEELGFRIIPLGLFSAYLVRRASGTGKDTAISFLVPGIIRRKYGIKLTKGDYILVIATSILFGFAHFLFGAWDPGKIISAALVGFILAFGFLKFGIFVDIPIHWFYNGFSTVYLIYPPMTIPWYMSILWILFAGAVALIFLLVLMVERKKKSNGELSLPADPLS